MHRSLPTIYTRNTKDSGADDAPLASYSNLTVNFRHACTKIHHRARSLYQFKHNHFGTHCQKQWLPGKLAAGKDTWGHHAIPSTPLAALKR